MSDQVPKRKGRQKKRPYPETLLAAEGETLPVPAPKPVVAEIVGPPALRTDEAIEKYRDSQFLMIEKAKEAAANDDGNRAKAFMIAAGVSTDKMLVLSGRPTEIVANVHAHRHMMPELIDRLARVARALRGDEPKKVKA